MLAESIGIKHAIINCILIIKLAENCPIISTTYSFNNIKLYLIY